ncbi:MAG: hypothetical protein FWC60_02115 [Firmicutes bacterium]|nr:hypothetical protein [Bacillota bacterium]
MPISYMELERLGPAGNVYFVPVNGVLIFDTVVSSVGTQISYDFATGEITFSEAGYYYIDWYVAPQFSLSTDGSNWAIKTNLSQLTFIGSSHIKVGVTTGFAILQVQASEKARLVNVSNDAFDLSAAVKSKAGLVVYSVAVLTTSS